MLWDCCSPHESIICHSERVLAGWQRYTEAVWLYTDALQQAPSSDAAASLHENRAAALLVRTLSSSSVCYCETRTLPWVTGTAPDL